jgi:hypothetical protein
MTKNNRHPGSRAAAVRDPGATTDASGSSPAAQGAGTPLHLSKNRYPLGFYAAIAAAYLSTMAALLGDMLLWRRSAPPGHGMGILIFAALFGGAVPTIATAAIFGLPLLAWAFRLPRLTLRACLIGGALAGLPASGAWLLVESTVRGTISRPLVAVWPISSFLPGLLAGWVFWWVAVKHSQAAP